MIGFGGFEKHTNANFNFLIFNDQETLYAPSLTQETYFESTKDCI